MVHSQVDCFGIPSQLKNDDPNLDDRFGKADKPNQSTKFNSVGSHRFTILILVWLNSTYYWPTNLKQY